MGIQGLFGTISAASISIDINELSNCVALVDIYCWLHKAVIGCSEDVYHNRETNYYVNYCLNKVDSLKKIGIKCILVFDGLNLPSKKVTEDNRQSKRTQVKDQIRQKLLEGKSREAQELMKRCIDITPEMAKKLIVACRQRNIDYIVAPYEADAQIGYLMKKRMGHLVITEDSDLLLFECDFVLVKLDKLKLGEGVLFRRSKIVDCFSPNFTFEKFRRVCILSGCDYLNSLPGIGLKKAVKAFTSIKDEDLRKALPKVPSYLRMKNLRVPKDYIEGFIRAENTFKHQLVFCPIERKLVPLNPYDDSVDPIDIEYAGKRLDDELALHWALGNVDKTTMTINDDWLPEYLKESPNSSDDSIWSINYKPRKINPLEVRFSNRLASGDLSTTSARANASFTQSIDNKRKFEKEESTQRKFPKIDPSILEIYRNTGSSDTDIVKSRHFMGQEFDDNLRKRSLDELTEEKAKRRQRLSFLCSNQPKDESTKTPEESEETPTPPSSQSSISSSQSSVLSSLSSLSQPSPSPSPSPPPSPLSAQQSSLSANCLELAEPITRFTPPSEKTLESKVTKNTVASLMERFAFKKRT